MPKYGPNKTRKKKEEAYQKATKKVAPKYRKKGY